MLAGARPARPTFSAVRALESAAGGRSTRALAVMRTSLVAAVVWALAGCGDPGRSHTQDKQPPTPAAGASVAYVDLDIPTTKLLKFLGVAPDPADDAQDAASCQRARGRWANSYHLGMLIIDHEEPGAERGDKRCWGQRAPTRLPDAGKVCGGQADCIGNCIAQKQKDGTWTPRCQINREDSICGPIIYDGGRYHSVLCPIA